jgi:hypothetical protein
VAPLFTLICNAQLYAADNQLNGQKVIEISDLRPVYYRDSVGVGFYLYYRGKDQTIVDFGVTLKPFDSYGLLVIGRNRRNVPALLKLEGAISPMREPVWLEWPNIWASKDVNCVEIQSLKVVFEDGQQEFYFRDIDKIIPEQANRCTK